jgi:hypothetical protein
MACFACLCVQFAAAYFGIMAGPKQQSKKWLPENRTVLKPQKYSNIPISQALGNFLSQNAPTNISNDPESGMIPRSNRVNASECFGY